LEVQQSQEARSGAGEEALLQGWTTICWKTCLFFNYWTTGPPSLLLTYDWYIQQPQGRIME
jgi:hypothetical protein